MSVRIAIIADDLTGALDTSAPFVRHGLRVAVAISMAGLAEVVRSDADVVVVNTGSREGAEAEAVARVDAVASALRTLAPEIVFKKIDSRLKGHVRAETGALCRRMDAQRLVIAPAVPDQGRPTVDGMVTGSGVATPIAIGPLFAGLPLPLYIADAGDAADLDAAAADIGPGTLAVGARGLGTALARRFGHADPLPPIDVATPRTLMAIGSRDPITTGQVEYVCRLHPELAVIEAPHGEVPAALPGVQLPLVLRCGGAVVPERAAAVARRFAAGVAERTRQLAPDCLWMTGGETGLAILDALTLSLVTLVGEVAPGVPVIACTIEGGRELRCVLKSGGFGSVDILGAAFDGQTKAHEALAGAVTSGRL